VQLSIGLEHGLEKTTTEKSKSSPDRDVRDQYKLNRERDDHEEKVMGLERSKERRFSIDIHLRAMPGVRRIYASGNMDMFFCSQTWIGARSGDLISPDPSDREHIFLSTRSVRPIDASQHSHYDT
jgi:hypothetical protein